MVFLQSTFKGGYRPSAAYIVSRKYLERTASGRAEVDAACEQLGAASGGVAFEGDGDAVDAVPGRAAGNLAALMSLDGAAAQVPDTGDGNAIDGTINGVAMGVVPFFTRLAGRAQSGYLFHYAFAMVLGIAALITWMTLSGGAH